MNEIQGVNLITGKSFNSNNVNFRASNAVTKPKENDNEKAQFIKDYEKAKKQANMDKNIQRVTSIGVLLAIAGSVGLTAYLAFGKGPSKTVFSKISENMPALTDDCINPKVRDFIQQVTKILKMPKDLLDYTGAKNPRMVLFYGPTGTGKTFSAQLLAKEMGAKYGEIQFSDLSSEYIGKTAVNITRKFKELKKLGKKHPNEQYVIAFNEMDSLIGNVEKLGSNNKHLAQNRTAFLNGLDSIKDMKNITIVGTTNINPHTAQLDQATLSRLGNIFEIEKPIMPEIKGALKFHLGKSKAADELIKNDAELEKLAQAIVDKEGAQRDVTSIVDDALRKFTIEIDGKSDAKTRKLTADYLQKAIDSREVWAAGIKTAKTPEEHLAQQQIPNSIMNKFWDFVANQLNKG